MVAQSFAAAAPASYCCFFPTSFYASWSTPVSRPDARCRMAYLSISFLFFFLFLLKFLIMQSLSELPIKQHSLCRYNFESASVNRIILLQKSPIEVDLFSF